MNAFAAGGLCAVYCKYHVDVMVYTHLAAPLPVQQGQSRLIIATA